ncbi:hypothetical protein SBRCBS47491_009140 [Sporothrix bragantina]|uniref:Zn(2)-C6 fungal-type domain-containing protein n=1 Tax=Sporothrix bragantina TaxID=671064 RepID=A0ABP0CVD4_9PEZI
MDNSSAKRLISCKRCQHRKIRCSRTFPCINCATAKAKCEFRDNDFKRPPVSREYVASLESRIATLERFLAEVKAAPTDDHRQAMLEHITFQDHLRATTTSGPVPALGSAPTDGDDTALREAMTRASLQETAEGSRIYHGPTSIFSDSEVAASESPSHLASPAASLATSTPQHVDEYGSLHGPKIALCIGLFFFWQYSQFMFIDREAFVQEYDQNPVNGEFCSEPLVYAICAIGALMSPDPDTRAISGSFATSAQDILLAKDMLGVPRVTSVQALLCCAYYEVGRGNLSKGWLFSGMAFRMGQDLGFQRDPAHWDIKSRLVAPYNFDNEFRRRIYWGSFVSDKIFSLFLGRPTFIHENDADVDISEPLPHDPPVWENWIHAHGLASLATMRPAGPKLTLLFNKQVELGRIIHDMLAHTFSPKKTRIASTRRDTWTDVSLNELNSRLVSWHESLPNDMRWKKWFAASDVLQPNVSVLHKAMHPNDVDAGTPDTNTRSALKEALDVCTVSVEAMVSVLQRFRSQHTLGNAPILFVHGAIVASNAVFITSRLASTNGTAGPALKDTHFPALDQALAEMAVSWELAGQARTKFRTALSLRQQKLQEQLDQQLHLQLVATTTGQVGIDTSFADHGFGEHFVTESMALPSTTVSLEEQHGNPMEDMYVWDDPLNIVDGNAAYWADLDTDFFVGWDAQMSPGILNDMNWTGDS